TTEPDTRVEPGEERTCGRALLLTRYAFDRQDTKCWDRETLTERQHDERHQHEPGRVRQSETCKTRRFDQRGSEQDDPSTGAVRQPSEPEPAHDHTGSEHRHDRRPHRDAMA